MSQSSRAVAGLIAALALSGAWPARGADAPVDLRMDTDLTIGGVGVACTGIGESKQDPRWLAYPLRVEFSDMHQQYLIGAEVTLATMARVPIMHVTCQGAWLLLKLPDRGSYRLEARIVGEAVPAQSRVVRPPARGQARVVIGFPGL